MVEPFDIATLGPDDPEAWRIIGDATRLAFADRERYIADSDFVTMPKGLLDPAYLKARSALIRRPTALGEDDVKAGEPPWDKAELRIDGVGLRDAVDLAHRHRRRRRQHRLDDHVDRELFRRAADGGRLPAQQPAHRLRLRPRRGRREVANRVEPGKRPRSSMAPTIVLKDGKPVFALGSPGGSSIISYVATTLIALIDWKMDMQAAVSLPHLVNRFGPYDLEKGTARRGLADDLEALGYKVAVKDLNSGLHGIAIAPDGLTGGADPRREGVAVGD